ncbi:MAG: hypothetical protein ACRDND_04040 [Streptosporangiaceae bacterium]
MRARSLAEISEDSPVHVDIGECPVCLVRSGSVVYALRDEFVCLGTAGSRHPADGPPARGPGREPVPGQWLR